MTQEKTTSFRIHTDLLKKIELCLSKLPVKISIMSFIELAIIEKLKKGVKIE